MMVINETGLKSTHVQIRVARREFGTHRGTAGLKIGLITVSKVIVGQSEMNGILYEVLLQDRHEWILT